MRRAFLFSVCAAVSAGAFAQGYAGGSVSEIRTRIAEEARGWKGVPYVYGGSGPAGFDCSGYTQYVYRKAAGIELPRRARDQYAIGTAVTKEEAQVGDLFIFDTIGGPSHVGIYLGDGNFSHAASEGSPSGIKISKITDNYYATKFLAGRAVLPRQQGSPQGQSSTQPAKPSGSPTGNAQSPGKQASSGSDPGNGQSQAQLSPPPQPPKPEIPVSTIGFTVGPRVLRYNDPIPAYMGTKVEFNVMNKSGADAEYEILFVKGDYDAGSFKLIWSGRKTIKDGTYAVTPEFLLDAIDYWQLVVKGIDGSLKGKRAFKSIQEK
jgi:hypothetical protein